MVQSFPSLPHHIVPLIQPLTKVLGKAIESCVFQEKHYANVIKRALSGKRKAEEEVVALQRFVSPDTNATQEWSVTSNAIATLSSIAVLTVIDCDHG